MVAPLVALEVFSIVFGVATMIPFLGTMIPGREPLVTTVRVIAGTGDNTDGNAPNVAAFDINGNLIGSVKGGDKVVKGAPYDAKIEVDADGDDNDGAAAQAHYISLSERGDDAICIAAITVTLPDGLQFAWYGDVAEYCGAPWYYSSTILSTEDLYTPKCVWIDGDATNGIKTKGIGLHLPSFVATEERAQSMEDNKDSWCKSKARLHFYDELEREDPIPYFDPPLEFEQTTLLDKDPARLTNESSWKVKEISEDDKKRRDLELAAEEEETEASTKKRATPPNPASSFRNNLVKSKKKHHSAKQLCNSPNSWGPDMVSQSEGLFCDMQAKKLYPLCSEEVQNNCFDVQADRMRGGRANARRDDVTGERIVRKRYEVVEEW